MKKISSFIIASFLLLIPINSVGKAVKDSFFDFNSNQNSKTQDISKLPMDSNYSVIGSFLFMGILQTGLSKDYGPKNSLIPQFNNYAVPLARIIFGQIDPGDQANAVSFYNQALEKFVSSSKELSADYQCVKLSTLTKLKALNIMLPANLGLEVFQPKTTNYVPWGAVVSGGYATSGFGFDIGNFFSTYTNNFPFAKVGGFNFDPTFNLAGTAINYISNGGLALCSNDGFGDITVNDSLNNFMIACANNLNFNSSNVIDPYMIYRPLYIFDALQIISSTAFLTQDKVQNSIPNLPYSNIFFQFWVKMASSYYISSGKTPPTQISYWISGNSGIQDIINHAENNINSFIDPTYFPWNDPSKIILFKYFCQSTFPFLNNDFIDLPSAFILNFFPSAPNVLNLSGATKEINQYFNNSLVSSPENVMNGIDHIMGTLSNIDTQAISYLKTLVSLSSSSLIEKIQPLFNIVSNSPIWQKVYNANDKNVTWQSSVEEFNLINKYANTVFLNTTNDIFDHGKSIPKDPWGSNVNSIRPSNILLFTILGVIVLAAISYTGLTIFHRKQAAKLPNYKNIGDHKELKIDKN